MSPSQKDINDPDKVRFVLDTYRTTELTQQQIAEIAGISHNSVHKIINKNLTKDEIKQLKKTRYRNSKLGELNPALGKTTPNYKGEIDDGKGYRKSYVDKIQRFVHRIVMAEAIGIKVEDLPSWLSIHHIDENPLNNNLDNLALVTNAAHRAIHTQMRRLGSLAGPHRSPQQPQKEPIPIGLESERSTLPAVRQRSAPKKETRTSEKRQAFQVRSRTNPDKLKALAKTG